MVGWRRPGGVRGVAIVNHSQAGLYYIKSLTNKAVPQCDGVDALILDPVTPPLDLNPCPSPGPSPSPTPPGSLFCSSRLGE